MAGREDYEERRQARIDRLNGAAYKAASESNAASKRSHDLVKDIPLGQPNIHGALTGVMNKSRNAADKSVEMSEKADYYSERAEAAENNHAISSDDPQALAKLQKKLEALEAEREKVKAFNKQAKKDGTEPYPWYTLPYLSKDIKRIKDRIASLQKIDEMKAEIISFEGGEIEVDVVENRVKITFDERATEEIVEKLQENGFRWAYMSKCWQRLRTISALNAAKRICERK